MAQTDVNVDKDIRKVVGRILSDVRVELTEEFDKNFTRQAFFSERWARRKGDYNADKTLLIDSGALRQSVRSEIKGDSVVFFSDLPYAAIHNDGGKIRVAAKMKGYFWHKYREVQPTFGRRKNGELRADKRNTNLSTAAEFYKAMALMKVGNYITIPRRRFIGFAPEVETAVRAIVEQNIAEYFNIEFKFSGK